MASISAVIKAVFIASIIMILSSSCASNQGYPENWTPLQTVRSGECPDLAGHYYVLRSEIMQRLGFNVENIKNNHANHMLIKNKPTGRYEISVWQDAILIEKKIVDGNGKNCSCRSDGLKLSGGTSYVGDNFAGIENEGYLLNKAQDGSLIVKFCTTSAGCMLLIPVVAVKCNYDRYEIMQTIPVPDMP